LGAARLRTYDLAVANVTSEAVAPLLAQCPELTTPWEDIRNFMGGDEEVGIYGLFTHLVNPFLSYAFEDGYQRRHLRNQPEWSKMPVVPSVSLDSLVDSLFYVLEVWAESGSAEIRAASRIELFEGTAEEDLARLLTLSGPARRKIARFES
jgi:hypothetical protein